MRSMIALVTLALAASACRPSDPRTATDSPSLDEWGIWEAEVGQEPPCAAAGVVPDTRWTVVTAREGGVALRLPRSFVEDTSDSAQGRQWEASDLSEFGLQTTTTPFGMAASGRTPLTARLHNPSHTMDDQCRLSASGPLGTVMQFRDFDAGGVDTVFSVAAIVAVRRGLAVIVFGRTPTRAMRDSLLAAVSTIRIEAPGKR